MDPGRASRARGKAEARTAPEMTLRQVVQEIVSAQVADYGSAAAAGRALGIHERTAARINNGEGFAIKQLEKMMNQLGGPVEFFRLHPRYQVGGPDPLLLDLRGRLTDRQVKHLAQIIRSLRGTGAVDFVLDHLQGLAALLEKVQREARRRR